jgi:tRNA-dihydrouridine synthase
MTRVFVMVAIVICSFCRGYSPKATRHTHMQVSNAFNRLRKPKFISAPMVDQSELAWRIFTRKNGCDMAYTQMINSKSFIRDINYRNDVIDWNDYSHISGDVMLENEARLLDSNTIVQVNGNDPDTVVQCASWFHRDVAAIDLNLGCPQNIAKRGNYGAYLLRNVELVQGILSNMVDKLDCPITAKVRILTDYEETLDLCRKLERTGIQLLTIHGRTVNSSKLFTGAADWKIIQAVKKELSIPVIANGGISCRDDALRCLEETGADGVMSAEGLLENPKLFSVEGDNGYKNDFIRFQLQTVREYLDVVKSFKYPRPFGPVVRGHLFKMLHRFLSVPIHNSYRERILRGNSVMMY